MKFFTKLEKNPNIHMEKQNILSAQSNVKQQKQKLEASQYYITGCTKGLLSPQRHGTAIITDTWIDGTK